jgi:hypothetical protein
MVRSRLTIHLKSTQCPSTSLLPLTVIVTHGRFVDSSGVVAYGAK